MGESIKSATDIRDGIEALELASGERLEILEFVRATLGANLDALIENEARNTVLFRETVEELVNLAIGALEELGEISPGLIVSGVTQGKVYFVIAESETLKVLHQFEADEEGIARAKFDAMVEEGAKVEIHRINNRDVVGVEFGIKKGTPTRIVERLLPYLGGGRKCLV